MSHPLDDDFTPMRHPSPDEPQSGYTPHNQPNYAVGHAPIPGPDGTIFLPELGTYVDADVAESLLDIELNEAEGEAGDTHEEIADADISDEELDDLREQLDDEREQADQSASLSDTLDAMSQEFEQEVIDASIEQITTVEDTAEILEALSDLSGLDTEAASTILETVVTEATPDAEATIGPDRWASIVYAASTTEDPFARRVVADFARGKLSPAKLSQAYAMWWNTLPDA